ncbi:IPT/TIG domain-containing protein [Streptomyces sp. NPDC059161]|uniref:IPT/TIG domain-containing protein n=1 Tax=Streptomyces sp. NPDC059161 TaxID=3346749 RepID=UPI003688B783
MTPAWGVRVLRPCCGLWFLLWGGRVRLHGEGFGLYRGARRRVLTVGALVLALSASVVPAGAASPSPSGSPPTAASGAPSPSSSPKSPTTPSPFPSTTAKLAPKSTATTGTSKAAAGAASTSNAVYAYDAAGRLVGLTDPAGETARYRYDPAGNRLGIDRFPSSQLSVLSVVPVRAAAGARVTLSGTGFSTTAASNAVSFGGTAATVVSATATRLVVTVPAGAKAGPVSVTVAGASAQSVEAFALATPAPVVSSFAPTSAVAGAQVVISGSGFAATATDDVVRFNGRVSHVVSASPTSLTVEVPPGASDGLIEVATRDGRGASAGNFSVVGSGGPVYDSVVTTTVSDANPPSVAVTTPGHLGEVLFDAEQGDDVSFGFTASTFNTGLTLKLLDPRGTQVDSRSLSSSGGDWDVRNLPLAGRYSLVVDPGSNNIGAATVTLSNPAGGALSLTGPSVAAQVNRPGQNGRWTLSAQAGQSLSVGFAVSAMTAGKSVDARLYGPDGAEVAGSYRLLSPNSTDSLDIDALPQTGTYTVVANPVDGATGTVTATGSLYADAGTLDPAGAAVNVKID